MDGSTKQTQVYDIQTHNQKTIHDYIEARKTETNLASSTQKVMIDNLNRFSRNTKKYFKDVTRDDVVSFLNSLGSEIEDPKDKWIGTYNLYVVTIGTFFKWLYYPQSEPKERRKPEILLNIKQLKRKEKSTYP
jgi:site-specific recombinase XerD